MNYQHDRAPPFVSEESLAVSEKLRPGLCVARRLNNAAVFRNLTGFLTIRVRKYIQARGDHVEHLTYVVNYVTLILYLTKIRNQSTSLFSTLFCLL
jgi:hypothetical protein